MIYIIAIGLAAAGYIVWAIELIPALIVFGAIVALSWLACWAINRFQVRTIMQWERRQMWKSKIV